MLKRLANQRSGRLLAFLFAAMIAALLVLGLLQYRWISEAADSTERQLRDNLDVSVSGFTQDFQDQVQRIGNRFRLPPSPDLSERDIAEQFRRSEENWNADAAFPDLLHDAFIVKAGTNPDKPVLLRFDSPGDQFQPVEWPSELGRLSETFRPGLPRPSPQTFTASIPALVFPLSGPPPNRGGAPRGRGGFSPFPGLRRGPPPPGRMPDGPPPERRSENNDWVILRLNRDVLQNKLMPQLVSRHFSTGSDAIYDLIIQENETRNVVYRSSPNLSANDFDISDARVPLGGWQLLVRHRVGSVSAAVQQLRRRNIAIGIVVLAILGAGLIATWVASERVRKLGQMQIELAAGISHELRTPLAVIRSAGYNMAAGHITGPQDIVRYGNLFQDQGRRLSEVVEQALLFAQTHSGKSHYVLQPADTVEIIVRVVESCNAIDAVASKRITLKFAKDLPLAMTDSTALSHCLHNLVMNALKYSGPNGKIEVATRRVDNKKEPEIEITVTDDGPGIERQDLPHLFEPFYRGRNSANTVGNGLGLYLVRQTMESIRGRATVSSSPGNGARFALYFPGVKS